MKAWLTQFRISVALDAGKPLPPSLRKALATNPELRRFEARTRALEHALTQTKPEVDSPPFLHRCIMRSVQAAAEPAAARPRFQLLRWLATPAVAVMFALGLWVALKPTPPVPNPAPLAAVSTTLELGNTMPQTLPPALVAPLSEELSRLNQDLTNTAQFLLASLP
jgi:hypothetical protein